MQHFRSDSSLISSNFGCKVVIPIASAMDRGRHCGRDRRSKQARQGSPFGWLGIAAPWLRHSPPLVVYCRQSFLVTGVGPAACISRFRLPLSPSGVGEVPAAVRSGLNRAFHTSQSHVRTVLDVCCLGQALRTGRARAITWARLPLALRRRAMCRSSRAAGCAALPPPASALRGR